MANLLEKQKQLKFEGDLLLLGGVASGKTEMMKALAHSLGLRSVDAGRYYRFIAYLLLRLNGEVAPSFELLRASDAVEVGRIIRVADKMFSRLGKYILNGINIDAGNGFSYNGEIITKEELSSDEVDLLVPLVAKSKSARHFVDGLIKEYTKDTNIILTAHSLEGINATDYRIINLRVDDVVAAERLMGRNPEVYDTIDSALAQVRLRNQSDGLSLLNKVISDNDLAYSIDTNELSIKDVLMLSMTALSKQSSKVAGRESFQSEFEIRRDDFKWPWSDELTELRASVELLSNEYDLTGIAKFDLILQTMIHVAGDRGDIRTKLERQLNRLKGITKRTRDIPIEYLVGGDPLNSDERAEVKEVSEKFGISYREIPLDLSARYCKALHYLHDGRSDDKYAFGAFLGDDQYPFAIVCYSLVGRDYKKDMLEYINIEPRLILEMTRAWNAPWAPKNTMSSLFTFAHNELRAIWREKVTDRLEYKQLAGILTSINPNMGFTASAFNGVGFGVIGLKPTQFTYFRDSLGDLTYMPRRSLVKLLGLPSSDDLYGHENFSVNQIELVETCEMLTLFDTKHQEEIMRNPVYWIAKESYQHAK